jgi:hypothetical protein
MNTSFEKDIGYRNNFFVCQVEKGKFEWKFQRDEWGKGFWDPFKYVEGVRRRNYEVFQSMKMFITTKNGGPAKLNF